MRVTILLFEPLSTFELGCAMELFALPRPEFDHWYTTKVVTLGKSPLPSLCNTVFNCEQVATLPTCELLVIPSFPVSVSAPDPKLINALQQHVARGGRVISFCSGAFLLAAAGLLDGRIATTHWRYADTFRQRFPQISYRDNILYHYDGQVGCSAGSAAGIDLGIEVIRQDFGYQYANSVARRMVLPAHRVGGQAQFIEKPLKQSRSAISTTLDWAVKNLSADLNVDKLAEKTKMTRRTFDRHFKKAHNITPLEWLNERKLDVARLLLETTELSIEQIALKAGFDNAVTLRHNFRKYLSVSPSDYRATFCQSRN